MSSLQSSGSTAETLARESVRCFDRQPFSRERALATAGYLTLAALTIFGCTRTAAVTQGTEASLLVAGFEASRMQGFDAASGLFESPRRPARERAAGGLAVNGATGERGPNAARAATEVAR